MNFVWKADRPLLSEEEIARRVHGVSLARSLDELATVHALMCIRQESNFWCPWNRKDPVSENYPHDSESDDGRSVGYFQQQNKVPGENPTGPGENWWGPMSSRMNLERSADVFLERLSDDYVNSGDDPHQAALFVQRVQGSFWDGVPGHPGDYSKHWGYCWDLLRRALAQGPIAPVPPPAPVPIPISTIRPEFQERQMFGWGSNQRSRKPINFFLHTEEGSWDNSAESLAAFCQGQNNVSYHYTLRGGILYDVVDTDLYSWSVLDANVFSINLCFAGSSVTQTRQQWLDRYGRDIEIAAYIAVQDARKYGFSTEVIVPPYNGNPRPGISDHRYVTQKLRIGSHTDVGDNFPWDVLIGHVNRFTGIGDDDVDAEAKQWIKEIRDAVGGGTPMPSLSPYAPDPPPVFKTGDYARYADAASHALAVEAGARAGVVSNVKEIKNARDRGIPRAVHMWDKLLTDELRALADSPDEA